MEANSTPTPCVADLMDFIRNNAQNLSDAIRQANKAGLNVHIGKASEGSEHLFQLIFSV